MQFYPDRAVNTLARCDPTRLLKEECDLRGHDYYSVMAGKDPSSDDASDTGSQVSSRRRTLSSDSRSPFISSASVVQSSSGSSDSSSSVTVWVSPDKAFNDCTPLKAKRLPQSDPLIQADIVTQRWKLTPKYLSDTHWLRYSHGSLPSDSTITLDWAWSSKHLKANRTQQTTFYLVEDLPDSEVVLGNCDAPDSPRSERGRPSDFQFKRRMNFNIA